MANVTQIPAAASNGKRSHSKRIGDLEGIVGHLRSIVATGYMLQTSKDGGSIPRPSLLAQADSLGVIMTRLVDALVARKLVTRAELGLDEPEEESRIVVPTVTGARSRG